TLHYLLGFQRLGYDVHYVEAHGSTPTKLMRSPEDDSSALAAAFIERVLHPFGFEGRWAFHGLYADGLCYGTSSDALLKLYQAADLIVNLHGATVPSPEQAANGRLVYLETDPVQVQIQLAQGDRDVVEYLEPHVAFFTFGENYGQPDCGLPVSPLFDFRPTRQPVLLDLWQRSCPPPEGAFRTIGNWRQDGADIRYEDKVYNWSKHHEFLAILDLPSLTSQDLELALARVDEPSRALLEERGWRLCDPLAFSDDIDAYRAFIHGSRGEFSVAKDQNVRLRTGWFSDRSATFLASGLPVVVQDTAFDRILPTGEGLFGFRTTEEAADAIATINAAPSRHGRAALEIAREYFSHEVVLGDMLAELGLRPRVDRGPRRRDLEAALPSSLLVMPVSRHPTELDPETVETVLRRPVPRALDLRGDGVGPLASVVVVTRDQLPLTRMSLETVLHANGSSVELIVVDNASEAETRSYLAELERRHPSVRTVLNRENRSYAASLNQGLSLASGALLVLLNNDTIVTPGWLEGLARQLEDATVGLVGPVTNEAGNEAEIDVSYQTYGDLLELARDRARAQRGRTSELPVATMFCAAMRREDYERIGPIDEGYEVGMFEDDDYSHRVRLAGLRVVCAEDVFVHHFGKGSFGSLVPTGVYAARFETNKQRFEAKWGLDWTGHSRRPSAAWDAAVADLRRLVVESLPADAVVLVVSRGDEALLHLGGRTGWHFPRNGAGEYAGHHPATSADAIAELERLRLEGATHLVFPSTELWWLDHYEELRGHLESRRVRETSAGVAYTL
nr:glycosyltransferase [Actinomycetota bacterium]